MRRQDKIKNIEKANILLEQRCNESLPPTITFTEHEVFSIIYEAFGDKIPENLIKSLQNALKSKGRNLDTPNPPEGAML